MSKSLDEIQLGARHTDGDTEFALYSQVATRVEICLFDAGNNLTAQLPLNRSAQDVWSVVIPNCVPSQRYGFRVDGPYDPSKGLRCNPSKLLIDPYTRQLDGELIWDQALLGYSDAGPDGHERCKLDSATYVPKSVVTDSQPVALTRRPRVPWRDTVIYELNVRGYTMRCPELTELERGRFAGLGNGQIIDHIKSLGITTIELLPVHAFVDEKFLCDRGLRNYWGYNTLSFFAPAGRYATNDPINEFKAMVNAIHDAGLEVILDVVYNHTAETDKYGPTLSFRGIDNQAYYRVEQDQPANYRNDTGCGNTINADNAIVQKLIIDSLVYWYVDMGVDGFRFDLGTILGRHDDGFHASHPLLQRIENHPKLRNAKLIAEPWDVGLGGYRLGSFGPRWAEWNDRYRDSVRRYWRGDDGETNEFVSRIHGSADLFSGRDAGPAAGINFVTSHDGYTLADLVTYNKRHNEANGEDNRDGHEHNFSRNYGHEGPTNDSDINRLRRQQRLNLLATLFVSTGTPMLLAGDEFGHSQKGNNNAYAQDNEIAWLDWQGLENDPEFTAQVRKWINLRSTEPLLRPIEFLHGEQDINGVANIIWLRCDGEPMLADDWQHTQAFGMLLSQPDNSRNERLAILFNRGANEVDFTLPQSNNGWQCQLSTAETQLQNNIAMLTGLCVAVFKPAQALYVA